MNRRELNAYLQEVLHNEGRVKNITYVVADAVNDFADQYHLIEKTGAAIVTAIEVGLTHNRWKIKKGVAVLETTHTHHLDDDDDDTFSVACITHLKPTPNGPKRYELRVVMMGGYM